MCGNVKDDLAFKVEGDDHFVDPMPEPRRPLQPHSLRMVSSKQRHANSHFDARADGPCGAHFAAKTIVRLTAVCAY